MLNWDDFRYIQAIHQAGNLSGAARLLGVNQTTVSRRLAALEDKYDVGLFIKDGHIHTPTDKCQLLLSHIHEMGQAAEHISNILQNHDHEISGKVRITSVHSIINHFLVPNLARFCEQYPKLQLDILASDQNLSLTKREVDIALRLKRPDHGPYVCKKLCDIPISLYGLRGRVWDQSSPWIGMDEAISSTPEQIWIAQQMHNPHPLVRLSSLEAVLTALKNGIGVAMLPNMIGDQCTELTCLSGEKAPAHRELWLIYHSDHKYSKRIQSVNSWVSSIFP